MAPSGVFPVHSLVLYVSWGAPSRWGQHDLPSRSLQSWETFMTGVHRRRVGGCCDDRSTGPEEWNASATAHHAGLEKGQQSSGSRSSVSEGSDRSLAIQCCSEDVYAHPRSRPASPGVSQAGGAGFHFQGVQGKQKQLERKRRPRSAFQTLRRRRSQRDFCHGAMHVRGDRRLEGRHTCICTRAVGMCACRNALKLCPISLTFGGLKLSSARWKLV